METVSASKLRPCFLAASLALVIAWWASAIWAEGLHLFSFTDSQGRYIVVNSLDKVPPEFRPLAREAWVRPFHATSDPGGRPATLPRGRLSSGADEPLPGSTGLRAEPDFSGTLSDSRLELEPPPPESGVATDPAWASASLWLGELEQLQDRGQKIWRMASTVPPTPRSIQVWHWDALRALEALQWTSTLQWKRGRSWLDLASALTGQYRYLFFTITNCLGEAGRSGRSGKSEKRLADELPPLLSRTRFFLDQLKRALPSPTPPDLGN